MVVGSQSSFMPMRRRLSKTAAMRGRSSASLPSFSTSEASVDGAVHAGVGVRLRQAARNFRHDAAKSAGVVWRLSR